jgi:putative tricarboxylic transport membrane protein
MDANPLDLFNGFATLFGDPMAIAMVFAGAIFGVVVGAIPGLTTAAAIAIILPVTFYMEPLPGLVLLYVIGKAGRYGGSIAAILFNTPGTSAAAATTIDGHPLAQQGRAGKAIKTGTFASVTGDLFGDMLLICFSALIASWTLQLGPPEYFAIYMMAFIVIGSVVSESVLRGLISAAFGILIAMIGLDFISGVNRLTFGVTDLMSGLTLVPVLIGVFVVSEVLVQAEEHAGAGRRLTIAPKPKTRSDEILEREDVKRILPVIFRSSLYGSVIGMLPGLGSAVACFVAYGEERRRAKRPELWGKGAVEGVAAPEAANNAVSGPAMIPLLTLGIPGSTVGAMMMGVFLIHGIQVGPSIFTQSGDIVYAMFAAGLIGILSYGFIGWNMSGLVGRMIASLPPRLIYPAVLMIGFLATYSVRNSLFDIGVSILFGLIGYGMRRYGFSAAAFVISFILAPGAEQALRQSLRMSGDDIGIFLERPIAMVFLGIGIFALFARSLPWKKIIGREKTA